MGVKASVIERTLNPARNRLVAITMAEFVLGVTRLLSEFEPNEGVKEDPPSRDPVPGVTGMFGGTGGDSVSLIFHKGYFWLLYFVFCFPKPYFMIAMTEYDICFMRCLRRSFPFLIRN